jgi:predicted DNA-binding helix-hairpin-helix protein
LPTDEGLAQFAPEKQGPSIKAAMGQIGERIAEAKEERRVFSPAGQSTQMIVGADSADDHAVLRTSATLYDRYSLKRVYYSAFSPIPDSTAMLPLKSPPLQRENRLYQADWLLRHYGFEVDEIASGGEGGMLDLEIDPKLAWALKNRHRFPVDVNQAEREMLLRVPGLGARAVDKLIAARRHTRLTLDDVKRLSGSVKRARAFIVAADHTPGGLTDRLDLRARLVEPAAQLSLF